MKMGTSVKVGILLRTVRFNIFSLISPKSDISLKWNKGLELFWKGSSPHSAFGNLLAKEFMVQVIVSGEKMEQPSGGFINARLG